MSGFFLIAIFFLSFLTIGMKSLDQESVPISLELIDKDFIKLKLTEKRKNQFLLKRHVKSLEILIVDDKQSAKRAKEKVILIYLALIIIMISRQLNFMKTKMKE